MSEIGNKAVLRKVAGLMNMLDGKQFPSVLDTGDIKAVVDISKYLQEPYTEFFTLTQHAIAAGSSAVQSFNMFRVGGLTANGGAVNQYGTGQTRDIGGDPPEDENYSYRVLSAGIILQMSAGQIAAEAAAGAAIQWNFGTSGSDAQATRIAAGSPAWYNFAYQNFNAGNGLTFDADQAEIQIFLNSASSGVNSAPSSWPMWVPGFFGAGVDITLTHRTGIGGPQSVWVAGTGGVNSFLTAVYGVKVPKSNGIIFG